MRVLIRLGVLAFIIVATRRPSRPSRTTHADLANK